MIFLDSDVIIEIINSFSDRGNQAIQKLEEEEQDTFIISSIVYEEVLFGIYKKLQINALPPNHPLLRFPVLEFSKEDAELAANIEITMEQLGKKKPRGDILIVSTVINQHVELFTFNKTHYRDITNLD